MASIVRLTGLDDFITPSQACIKPAESPVVDSADGQGAAPRTQIAIEEDGRYMEVSDDGSKRGLKKAAITLADCLACSGCVTSAESVLVEMQTYKELEDVLARNAKTKSTQSEADVSSTEIGSDSSAAAAVPKRVVVSVSPQSVASLAVRHGLTAPTTFRKIAGWLKSIGVDAVLDSTFGRGFSLVESYREFASRFAVGGPLPMLTSACPGWICYAEKTHGDFVLPFISSTKSPQQVMGALVKRSPSDTAIVADSDHPVAGLAPDQVYHVAVMPCYDKKLEASRDDFYSDVFKTRDVDCVITTGELETMMQERGVDTDWSALPESEVDSLAPGIDKGAGIAVHSGGGAGGYLEHVFKRAARELFGVPDAQIEFEARGRNPDFREAKLKVNGEVKLVFAAAYGFKSIQTVMRQMKNRKKKCPYHFIEIMACPKGCNNGGGQLAPLEGDNDHAHAERVEQVYHEHTVVVDPDADPALTHVYSQLGADSASTLRTQYHQVERTIVPQLESW